MGQSKRLKNWYCPIQNGIYDQSIDMYMFEKLKIPKCAVQLHQFKFLSLLVIDVL